MLFRSGRFFVIGSSRCLIAHSLPPCTKKRPFSRTHICAVPPWFAAEPAAHSVLNAEYGSSYCHFRRSSHGCLSAAPAQCFHRTIVASYAGFQRVFPVTEFVYLRIISVFAGVHKTESHRGSDRPLSAVPFHPERPALFGLGRLFQQIREVFQRLFRFPDDGSFSGGITD